MIRQLPLLPMLCGLPLLFGAANARAQAAPEPPSRDPGQPPSTSAPSPPAPRNGSEQPAPENPPKQPTAAADAQATGAPPASEDAPAGAAESSEDDEYADIYAEEFGEEDSQEDGAPGSSEPTEPPPKGMGIVWGVLTDTKYQEPLMDATVSVVGTRYAAVTDLDGRFRLQLPPGKYSLRFFAPLHQPTRLDGVVVGAGGTVEQSLQLEPDAEQEVIDVVGEIEKANVEGQTLVRQRSASVGDSVGRHEISKSGDSTAAQAAQRVVGATIVGGRFVYVRGLGERYSNALFDGAPLPSPEPDRAAVPLDVFPAEVLDSVNLVKTFTPDSPGDFAGGSVRVQTRAIPDEFVFSAGASLGFNSESTFRDRLNYSGSATDWLGFDSSRSLPRGIPANTPRRAGEAPDGTVITRDQLVTEGKLLNSSFGWRDNVITPPDFGANVVIGNGWALDGGRKLGAIAALTYKRGWDVTEMKKREFRANDSDPRGYSPLYEYDITKSTDSVQWGAFGSVAYQLSPLHTLRLVTLRSQIADDETEVFGGASEERSAYVTGSQLKFSARALSALKLSGEHEFDTLSDARLDWSALYSLAERDEPDTRDISFAQQPDTSLMFQNTADSGRHFFSTQNERGVAGTLDWTQPLLSGDRAKIKLGTLASLKDRTFSARRFNFSARAGRNSLFTCDGPELSPDCVDSIFTDEALDSQDLRMEEGTQRSDGYDADLDVIAGYVMADVEPFPGLRAIVGERIEHTRQTIEPWDFGTGTDPGSARLSSTDLLPSVSLVYSATETIKLRAAGSRTLARPQLRELAPFAYSDTFGGRATVGNPDLELTYITNADLRVEYFPTMREVMAVSAFYKRFTDPIELTLLATGGSNPIRSYRNTPGADLYGIEFEARKELTPLAEALRDFTIIANLTLARSRIDLEQTGYSTLTTLKRPMMNQAPWVVNVALDYDNRQSGTAARVLYNVRGRQIVEVGALGIPDAYEQPRHAIDVVASQKLGDRVTVKAGVDNVLNARHLITQGKTEDGNNAREEYTEGVVVSLGVGYTL